LIVEQLPEATSTRTISLDLFISPV